jgi:hypothetical protein
METLGEYRVFYWLKASDAGQSSGYQMCVY